ncbi:Hsp20/alpha crystallin family protein [Pelotomaculum terephthalicicum JT]|uniref:Hsp20/alpha crystallin family protein n=1 Tax=Pelotomaculum TaxID=191373 RepID=UPI0009C79153|nr:MULTISPECIES: Hsp20/alpha crystallin family protein [Pelotomaculum]MCG9967089.1 Hsp20/alpha crystallin family protein [Pelotomaculum terephthalicicum JT]OPX89277.1 MAG: 18 kDa heat shock protein [Pelotomaculum sp. PtaB.Bin117]OPY63865.1 MAG: 18 kDa heat shock protein [Pelotomaculum sp. PtaU1.Bin065]
MDLIKWDPFHELTGLQSSINRLFDENFRHPRMLAGTLAHGWAFPVDIKDTPDAVLIKAEIPGANKEDIQVTFNDNLLTIRGERRKEEKEEGANFLRTERSYGSFSRSFTMDIPVKHDEMKARYRDGILEIVLPKDMDARKVGKNIEIQ